MVFFQIENGLVLDSLLLRRRAFFCIAFYRFFIPIFFGALLFLLGCSGDAAESDNNDKTLPIAELRFSPTTNGVIIELTNFAEFQQAGIQTITIIVENEKGERKSREISLSSLTDGYAYDGLISGDRYSFTLMVSQGDGLEGQMISFIPAKENQEDYEEDRRITIGTDANNNFRADIDEDQDKDGFIDREDVDDDGDGLIEIASAAELYAIRYQLDGRGRRMSPQAALNTTGCGRGQTACRGYELVQNISLADYDEGKGWEPLKANSISIENSCQAVGFSGIFAGNNWTVSDLTVIRPAEDCVGLFGYLAPKGKISNLKVMAKEVRGRNYVGSLVGYGGEGEIVSSRVIVDDISGIGGSIGGLMGYGDSARIISASIGLDRLRGDYYIGGLVGDGSSAHIISSSVIAANLEGNSRLGGMVGYGQNTEIRDSFAAIGNMVAEDNDIGGLIGDGSSASIVNSYVNFNSLNGRDYVGGLIGYGNGARIRSSSATGVSLKANGYANGYVGGLLANGDRAQIISSIAIAGNVSGSRGVGGLIGYGNNASIISSASVAILLGGEGDQSHIGGLVGNGWQAEILSSLAISGLLRGDGDQSYIGGLVGDGREGKIASSLAVASFLKGEGEDSSIGGLIGSGYLANITSSYAVSGLLRGSYVGGLLGYSVDANERFSYWDSNTGSISPITGINEFGTPQTSEALRSPMGYEAIYEDWLLNDDANRVRCHALDGQTGRVWDFGSSNDYPLLRCIPIYEEIGWNSWWRIDEEGKPVLNQALLSDTLGEDDLFAYVLAYVSEARVDPSDDKTNDMPPEDNTALPEEDEMEEDPTNNRTEDISLEETNGTDSTVPSPDNQDEPDNNIEEDYDPNDIDNDGHRNNKDVDDDGDGLIEIATAAELDAVRHQLNGRGQKLSSMAKVDRTGCGNGRDITRCNGYELINNISLMAYANADEGKGWQPLNSPVRCDDDNRGFSGIFEGNNWTISDLKIARPDEDCVGLFGYVKSKAIIRNLRLIAEEVMGRNRVGALVGYGESFKLLSSSAEAHIIRGNQDIGGLIGYGIATQITSSSAISDLLTGGDNIGGLLGVGQQAEIIGSSAVSANISGNNDLGGLVGYGSAAKVVSSSAVSGNLGGANRIGGMIGRGQSSRIIGSNSTLLTIDGSDNLGGLIGEGASCQINVSSAFSGFLIGDDSLGGLVGLGNLCRIIGSSAISVNLSGNNYLGGLVGNGFSAEILSSSSVSGSLRGNDYLGGLVGSGNQAEILSSSSVLDSLRGNSYLGGLVGDASSATIVSSPAISGSLTGVFLLGGLAGNGQFSKIVHSYVIAGSLNGRRFLGGLLGSSYNAQYSSSYWSNKDITRGFGMPQDPSDLRSPTSYAGIYGAWDNGTDIDNMDNDNNLNTGIDNITIWCDRDNSGSIEAAEQEDVNLIWDFGTTEDYPAIGCAPIDPTEWRSWWFLNRTGEPQLNQTRLDALLP